MLIYYSPYINKNFQTNTMVSTFKNVAPDGATVRDGTRRSTVKT